jgi:hypothetical protein
LLTGSNLSCEPGHGLQRYSGLGEQFWHGGIGVNGEQIALVRHRESMPGKIQEEGIVRAHRGLGELGECSQHFPAPRDRSGAGAWMGQQDAVLLPKLQSLSQDLSECHNVGHCELESSHGFRFVVVDADQ